MMLWPARTNSIDVLLQVDRRPALGPFLRIWPLLQRDVLRLRDALHDGGDRRGPRLRLARTCVPECAREGPRLDGVERRVRGIQRVQRARRGRNGVALVARGAGAGVGGVAVRGVPTDAAAALAGAAAGGAAAGDAVLPRDGGRAPRPGVGAGLPSWARAAAVRAPPPWRRGVRDCGRHPARRLLGRARRASVVCPARRRRDSAPGLRHRDSNRIVPV
mmetsp:Transcript_77697/g.219702  ORF Transcript_77697/g.219702 Transcript_77697/m.219702 type:complete len:218 (+) Transcript_77697:58-711(+)